MKIAVLSESEADDAAVRILVEGLVGGPVEWIGIPWLRTRGWPSILEVLPKVILHIHYQTDAHGLVVVADSDRTPLHQPATKPALRCAEKCRFCRLWNAVETIQLAPVSGQITLGIAVGLAVPSIEAWYRCGLDHQIGEAVWRQALDSGAFPYTTRQLKQAVYGTAQPSMAMSLQIAVEQAKRLVEANELLQLERLFPIGFGSLAKEVRSWLS